MWWNITVWNITGCEQTGWNITKDLDIENIGRSFQGGMEGWYSLPHLTSTISLYVTNSGHVSLETNYLVITVTPALLRTQFKYWVSLRSAWVIPRICLCLGPHMYLDWEEKSCVLLVSIYLCYVSAPSLIDILWMNQIKDSKDIESVYSFIVTITHRVPPPPFEDAYAHASLTSIPYTLQLALWLNHFKMLLNDTLYGTGWTEISPAVQYKCISSVSIF